MKLSSPFGLLRPALGVLFLTVLPAFANEPPSTPLTSPQTVMAVVAGKPLTGAQLDDLAQQIDPGLARLPEDQRRFSVLKLYLDMQALAHAAVKEGLDKSQAYEKRMSLMRDNVLQQLYYQQQIADKITKEDIQARYDKEIASQPKEEQVRVRHILVKTKKEAEDVIKRLNKGESFETLAKDVSQDGSAAVGGDLGFFGHGEMVPPFEAAAFALKPGAYTKTPVESPFGWHVIKMEARRDKPLPSLEEVGEVLRNMIARERYAAEIPALRRALDITYPDPKIQQIMEKQDQDTDSLPGEEVPSDEDQD